MTEQTKNTLEIIANVLGFALLVAFMLSALIFTKSPQIAKKSTNCPKIQCPKGYKPELFNQDKQNTWHCMPIKTENGAE